MLTQLISLQHSLRLEAPIVELCERLHEGRTLAERVRRMRAKRRKPSTSAGLLEVPGESEPVRLLLWCNTHQRELRRCKSEGGIMLPCVAVDLTGLAELEEVQDGN